MGQVSESRSSVVIYPCGHSWQTSLGPRLNVPGGHSSVPCCAEPCRGRRWAPGEFREFDHMYDQTISASSIWISWICGRVVETFGIYIYIYICTGFRCFIGSCDNSFWFVVGVMHSTLEWGIHDSGHDQDWSGLQFCHPWYCPLKRNALTPRGISVIRASAFFSVYRWCTR